MNRVLQPIAIVALALAVFGAWMHPAVLDPTNVGWLLDGNDRGVGALGLSAYLRAGSWPWLRQPLLGYPEGLPLLFTDSVPLLGLLLKLLGVPSGLQFTGWWYLACVTLQAGFGWALVRRHTNDPLVAWLGTALLTAMPVLFNRYGHPSLCAQWLLLWALWIAADERRARRAAWWAAVLATAAAVHSYLLVMVAAAWGGTLLRRLVAEDRRWAVLASAVAGTVPAIGIVLLHRLDAGGFVPSRLYGRWPMALDAWWNPANPDYARLLPSSPDDGTGRGFEGLQYLGAGLLALVPLAAWLAWRGGGERAEARRLAWLLVPFATLAVVAIGPAPLWRGEPLFAVALPLRALGLLDPVRAAGRLGWPLTYLLAYAAIATVARTRRAALLLGVALAVQAIDLSPMVAAVRETSHRADDRTVFARTPDPRWNRWIAQAATIQVEPPTPFADLAVLEEVAWRAVARCRPMRYFYAARDERAARVRLDREGAAFRAGRLDPTRLYLILSGPVPAAVRPRVVRIDGIPVVPPSAPASPRAC